MRHKTAIIISFCIIILSTTLHALEIRGTVVSTAQNPVEGAVVLHRQTGARALTGSSGDFAIDVPDEADRVRLEVIHPDFYEQEFVVAKREFRRKLILALVPLIQQSEELLVTALRYPEPSIKVPAAATVVEGLALTEIMAPNITGSLQSVPGVAALGSGGFSLVPSVRGLARRRILYLVDGARIESDRRTGPNASFVNPGDIDRIEVLRSPSSVFYGSDAIGGVIHLMTKSPSLRPGIHGRLTSAYGTVNGEKGLGLALEGAAGNTGFLLSLQGVDAEEYSSPLGKVLQSQFTQGSLMAKVLHRTETREIEAGFLGTRGTDIGKPIRTSEVNPTWYPRENQNLFRIDWTEKGIGRGGELRFMAFLNPNFLETRKEAWGVYKTKEEFARTESSEYGVQISYGRRAAPSLRFEGGVDLFGRGAARAYNEYVSFDEAGGVTEIIEEIPFNEGRRKDVGFFLSADYSGLRNLDILGGVRLDFIHQRAVPSGALEGRESTDGTGTGFLAVSYKIGERLTAFINISRAYRVPSLSELFYTGISGRGIIVANPDLVPETSLNLDGGVKLLGRRIFAGLYGFRYEIRDMIERYRIDATTRTYGNIEKGRITGLELEVEVFVLPGWKVFGNVFTIRGRSVLTGAALNDIPPLSAYAGTRLWLGSFSAEATATFRLRKESPGPDEIPIPGSEFVSLRAGYQVRSLNFFVALANVFNTAYLARPDSDAMEEPGRNLKLGVAYSF